MRTKEDCTINFRHYGPITIPAWTKLTHRTALGYDDRYNFVDDFNWIDNNYPKIAKILKHDAKYYGINIPIEYVLIDDTPKYCTNCGYDSYFNEGVCINCKCK